MASLRDSPLKVNCWLNWGWLPSEKLVVCSRSPARTMTLECSNSTFWPSMTVRTSVELSERDLPARVSPSSASLNWLSLSSC